MGEREDPVDGADAVGAEVLAGLARRAEATGRVGRTDGAGLMDHREGAEVLRSLMILWLNRT